MDKTEFVTASQAQAFLATYLDTEPLDVALIGEGAWSRCFGFRQGDEELAIRFGKHVDDFHKDQLAAAYATPALPVPEVFAVGQAFDGYFAISRRAYGIPLESVSAAQWRAVVPDVVSALEAMRTTDLSSTTGFGGWGADGQAPCATWTEFLLAVGDDPPEHRTYGWRKRLAAVPEGEAAFAWGIELLKQVATDAIPRCLMHCDLMNRNVLVQADRITAVFDWGCSLYGDHLYDLAWFEFWAPWTPELDIHHLKDEALRTMAGSGICSRRQRGQTDGLLSPYRTRSPGVQCLPGRLGNLVGNCGAHANIGGRTVRQQQQIAIFRYSAG